MTSVAGKRGTLAHLQLVLGFAFVLSFIFFSVWARFPIPYRDDWDWLGSLLRRPVTLRTLFEPHNEHLIPLPRLLVALQYWLEGSRTHLIFVVALTAQLVVGWIFWCEIRRRWPADKTTTAFVFGTAAVCLFFSHQLQSIVFMAAVLFPLVQVFAVLSIAAELNASEPGKGPGWLVAASLAAAGAALTTTNGLVVPLVLSFGGWARGASRWRVAAFAGAGLVGLGLYVVLVGQPWRHGPPPAGLAWNVPPIGSMLAFFLTFFASALAYGSLATALVLGTILFALGCVAVLGVASRRASTPRIEHFAVGVMLFAMVSALMATPARAQFGALQAAQSRYATYAMAYDAALLLWIVSRISSSAWWARHQASVFLATVVASTAVFVGHVFIGTVWKAKADNMAFVGLALATEVDDDEWIATLHPVTPTVHESADRLRRANDLHLTDPRVGIRFAAPPALTDCEGAVDLQSLGPAGWRAFGTINTRAEQGVIVDRSGILTGLAEPAPLIEIPNPMEPQVVVGVWSAIRHPAAASPPRWLGFARTGDGAPYTFYALARDGQPECRSSVTAQPEPIRVFIDAPTGVVSGTAAGHGWAFQCGGTVSRIAVLVDGIEQPLIELKRGVQRPDVQAAFAHHCEVGAGNGFSFLLDTRRLAAGNHLIRATASNPEGYTIGSNSAAIVVE